MPERTNDAIARLTAWIRDYGDQKEPVFIEDLKAVLAEVERLGGECGACGTKGEKLLTDTYCAACEIDELKDQNANLANLFLSIPEGAKLFSDFVSSQAKEI